MKTNKRIIREVGLATLEKPGDIFRWYKSKKLQRGETFSLVAGGPVFCVRGIRFR